VNILFFYPISALVIFLSCGVVYAANPVHCAILLVAVMIGIAGLFLCLGCELLAMLQILVYAGAIMVLFLFIVMTVDTRKEEKFANGVKLAQTWGVFLSVALGLLFLFISLQFSRHLPDSVKWLGDAKSMGAAFLNNYALPFEAITMVLLAAMVGVVVMSREPMSQGPMSQGPTSQGPTSQGPTSQGPKTASGGNQA